MTEKRDRGARGVKVSRREGESGTSARKPIRVVQEAEKILQECILLAKDYGRVELNKPAPSPCHRLHLLFRVHQLAGLQPRAPTAFAAGALPRRPAEFL